MDKKAAKAPDFFLFFQFSLSLVGGRADEERHEAQGFSSFLKFERPLLSSSLRVQPPSLCHAATPSLGLWTLPPHPPLFKIKTPLFSWIHIWSLSLFSSWEWNSPLTTDVLIHSALSSLSFHQLNDVISLTTPGKSLRLFLSRQITSTGGNLVSEGSGQSQV